MQRPVVNHRLLRNDVRPYYVPRSDCGPGYGISMPPLISMVWPVM